MNILTDEEILAAMTPEAVDGDWYLPQTFARAIEAEIMARLADKLKDAERFAFVLNDTDTNIGICLLSDGEYGEPRYMHKEEAIERIDAAMRDANEH